MSWTCLRALTAFWFQLLSRLERTNHHYHQGMDFPAHWLPEHQFHIAQEMTLSRCGWIMVFCYLNYFRMKHWFKLFNKWSNFCTWNKLSLKGLVIFSKANGMAPSTSLILLFICSWLWSRPIFDNFRLVFWTANFPFANSLYSFGWLRCKALISYMWTGNHLW